MQLNVSGHHVEVTEPLREYVESKFERLQRHYDQISNIHVTLIVEKMVQKAEATIHISGADLFAHARLPKCKNEKGSEPLSSDPLIS